MPKNRNRLQQNLDVSKVLEQFRAYENSEKHRKRTFKLDSSFEEATKRILKAKPQPRKGKKRG